MKIHIYTANKNRYEGEWRNGLKHGKGKYFYIDNGQVCFYYISIYFPQNVLELNNKFIHYSQLCNVDIFKTLCFLFLQN